MTKLYNFFKLNYQNKPFLFLYSLAALSGILIGTTYIPFSPWALTFCYIPLWFSLILGTKINLPLRHLLGLSWLTQFILTLIGFHWLYVTAREFGSLPIPISILILLLFATFMHIYIPLSHALTLTVAQKIKLSTPMTLMSLALMQILAERIWPSIFEWNLGYTLLWNHSPFAQHADIIGFWGLSACVLALQGFFAFLIAKTYEISQKSNLIKLTQQDFQSKKYPLQPYKNIIAAFVTVMFFLSFMYQWGSQKYQFYKTQELSWPQFNVMITQANIGNDDKLLSEKGGLFQPFVVNSYINITDQALNKTAPTTSIDALIWPETALPLTLDQIYLNHYLQKRLLQKISEWNIPLITGAYSQDQNQRDHLGNFYVMNSIFFMNGQGSLLPNYNKTDLLVFGEYMPFGEQFPFLYNLLPFVGNFVRGPGPTGLDFPLKNQSTIKVGPQICYESLNPKFSRELNKKNVQVIVNVTNDNWFGTYFERYQHMTMTLARGLENRIPLIRSTNTGISTGITASGDFLQQSPRQAIWTDILNIKYNPQPQPTFYALWGYLDWVIWLGILLIIFARAVVLRK